MQIVIDIDEKDYDLYKVDDWNIPKCLRDAIANGTPLPKGHGRLIDADELYLDIQTDEEMRLGEHLLWVKERVDNAPTVIEADTETWNSCHGQVTVPKGTMERIYNEADNVHDI